MKRIKEFVIHLINFLFLNTKKKEKKKKIITSVVDNFRVKQN